MMTDGLANVTIHRGSGFRSKKRAARPENDAADSRQTTPEDVENPSDSSMVPDTEICPPNGPTQSIPQALDPGQDTDHIHGGSTLELNVYLPSSDSREGVSSPLLTSPNSSRVCRKLFEVESQGRQAMQVIEAALDAKLDAKLDVLEGRLHQKIELLQNEVFRSQRAPDAGLCGLHVLSYDAADTERLAWIQAMQSKLSSQPSRPDHIGIHFALGHVEREIQEDWDLHIPTLLYKTPETDIQLGDLWRFIRGERLEPKLFEQSYRRQLQFIRQDEHESPKHFFRRWIGVYRRVRPDLLLTGADKSDLAYHYYFRLHEKLQLALGARNCQLETVQDVSNEAEKIWQSERQETSERASKRPNSDESEQADVESDQADDYNPRHRCEKCTRRGHSTGDCRAPRRQRYL